MEETDNIEEENKKKKVVEETDNKSRKEQKMQVKIRCKGKAFTLIESDEEKKKNSQDNQKYAIKKRPGGKIKLKCCYAGCEHNNTTFP